MKKVLSLIYFFFLIFSCAIGQDSKSKKEIRKQKTSFLIPGKPWTAELPIWVPGFAGSFAYGDVEIEGEDGLDPAHPIEPPPGGDFGAIISRLFQKNWYLRYFFITRLSFEKNKILLQFDAFSGSVGNTVKFRTKDNEFVDAYFGSINLRVFTGYKIVETLSENKTFRYELFVYAGARVYIQTIYTDLKATKRAIDFSPSWGEPIIGLQNQFTWKRWMLIAQGDYGGFLGNKRNSNQISIHSFFRTGKTISVKLGWNHLHIFHKGLIRGEEYKVKVTLSGPSVGIAFHF